MYKKSCVYCRVFNLASRDHSIQVTAALVLCQHLLLFTRSSHRITYSDQLNVCVCTTFAQGSVFIRRVSCAYSKYFTENRSSWQLLQFLATKNCKGNNRHTISLTLKLADVHDVDGMNFTIHTARQNASRFAREKSVIIGYHPVAPLQHP